MSSQSQSHKSVPCPQCGRMMENIAGSKRLSHCSCGFYEGCC